MKYQRREGSMMIPEQEAPESGVPPNHYEDAHQRALEAMLEDLAANPHLPAEHIIFPRTN
jgi:hypothetical protein